MTEEIAVHPDATIGQEYREDADDPKIGTGSVVRSGTTIYCDVTIGSDFQTGHDVLVREQTSIGDDVLAGTKTVIDGYSDIGSHVSLQTGVYVPSHTTIGDNVFVGPQATLTNDPYPIRRDAELCGPTLKRGISVGANATILPDVTVGEHASVAAGAVVTTDVSPNIAVGVPADHRSLPEGQSGKTTMVPS